MDDPSTTSRGRSVRAFAALDLPDAVGDGIEAWGARELGGEGLPAVRAAGLHVTLAFLGHLAPDDAERAGRIVAGVAARPVPMRLLADPVAVPRRRPRLYALGAESKAAGELQAEVAGLLAEAGLYEPEERPFWPHVTVARVRKGGRPAAPGRVAGELLQPFDAVRIRLYRSILRPGGSEYEPLASLDLPPAATEPGAEER